MTTTFRPADNLPPTARAIALILSSTPSVQDAQPGVLHQLLEFSSRYTQQVLTDAKVYADHAGRQDKLDIDDVILAVQARVGWEFGGRIPSEYISSLATQTNAIPLPSVPEVFGVRLPQSSDCLTSLDFDLIPNKAPPGVKIYDEEIEEIEESESEEEEEEMELATIPNYARSSTNQSVPPESAQEAPFPISAIHMPSEADADTKMGGENGSDAGEEEDGLFAGGDDDSDGMEEVQTSLNEGVNNEMKRKLVETDDYD
ncbi:transcription initiation factor IID, 31kD subunit-domain-containing protein [Lentinula edodes]|uniref:Transcription initiation factor IID, 31kD subunit-domain-containing protein n=1 Tax=Lentinula lateritia TaxID=40482 RepID=A0A9W9AXW4_9AGAR|nr:transcription initiation factor IID, 31kD subunit-domain-containing protein [Lentinula edodes]